MQNVGGMCAECVRNVLNVGIIVKNSINTLRNLVLPIFSRFILRHIISIGIFKDSNCKRL